MEGAGSANVDGIYLVSQNEDHPPREDFCLSGPPHYMPLYIREGGGCLLRLLRTAEEKKDTWFITRFVEALMVRGTWLDARWVASSA